jgi:uncharacterized membrane protein (DUF2068 family)
MHALRFVPTAPAQLLRSRKEAPEDQTRRRNQQRYVGLWVIASFKLMKGLLLLAVAIGALTLLKKDVAEQVAYWITVLRVDPDNHFIHSLLVKLSLLDNHKLEEIGAGTFFYAALLLTEGIGLLLRKRWAEYFTVIATGSLIPLEIYELVQYFSIAKIAVLGVNVMVVWYLIARLTTSRTEF